MKKSNRCYSGNNGYLCNAIATTEAMPDTMTNEEFIHLHRDDDVRKLALKRMPEGVGAQWCLQQIEGRQLAQRKLPRWAAADGLWFPPRLAVEQCSGEATALYKRRIIERLLPDAADRETLADLTGGYGVDFSYMAPLFAQACYVERQEELCRIARHNFPLLCLGDAEVVCAEAEEWAKRPAKLSLAYLDPARRDNADRKVVALEDCSPNAASLQDTLLDRSTLTLTKLSPMLDICMALRKLKDVREVHVVSVRGECKELLLVQGKPPAESTMVHCVNLGSDDPDVVCPMEKGLAAQAKLCDGMGIFLYEPNASILKAGVQDFVAASHGLEKLHRDSHLYTGDKRVEDFPGRSFMVEGCCSFGKRELREMLKDIRQANITVRNFPATAAQLRTRLKLKEGGNTYLFATTASDGRHLLVKCRKVAAP